MPEYLAWFIAGLVLIIVEIFAPGFVIVWFGIGALGAGVVAVLGGGYALQFITFFAISIVSLVLTKMFMKKKEEEPGLRVGAERLIGKSGKVVKAIAPNEFGEVKVEGDIWIAGSDTEIAVGEWVIVEKLEGAHVVVHKRAY